MRPATPLRLAIVLALVATPALPDWLSGSLSRAGFGNGDYTVAKAAGAGLFEDGVPEVGDSVAWENEASGSSGTIEIVEVFERGDGRTCVRLGHTARSSRMTEPETFAGLRCRAEDGRWLIAGE